MFKNKLLLAVLILLAVLTVALVVANVSAGDATKGHIGDIIVPLL